jgi:hypothetical protein
MQNEALVHDTPVSDIPPKADEEDSRCVGPDQLVPFQVIDSPVASTATQKDASGQDTSVNVEVVP